MAGDKFGVIGGELVLFVEGETGVEDVTAGNMGLGHNRIQRNIAA